jgi:hypothetical protein
MIVAGGVVSRVNGDDGGAVMAGLSWTLLPVGTAWQSVLDHHYLGHTYKKATDLAVLRPSVFDSSSFRFEEYHNHFGPRPRAPPPR